MNKATYIKEVAALRLDLISAKKRGDIQLIEKITCLLLKKMAEGIKEKKAGSI